MSEIKSPYSVNQVTVFGTTAEAYGKGKMFGKTVVYFSACKGERYRDRGGITWSYISFRVKMHGQYLRQSNAAFFNCKEN